MPGGEPLCLSAANGLAKIALYGLVLNTHPDPNQRAKAEALQELEMDPDDIAPDVANIIEKVANKWVIDPEVLLDYVMEQVDDDFHEN